MAFGIPKSSSRVSRSSPIACIMTPSLPLTVMDLPLGVKSRTEAYSSYFLAWLCSPWLKCPAAASCVDGGGGGGGCCPDNVQLLLHGSGYLTLSIFFGL